MDIEKEILEASYDFTESEGFRHGARWAVDKYSAVNVNAELLSALEACSCFWGSSALYDSPVALKARAAISKAKGV